MNLRKVLAAGAIALAAFFILRPVIRSGVHAPVANRMDQAQSAPQTTGSPAASASEKPKVVRALSPEEQKQVLTLKEIFRTRNDNDPRMDTELRHLSPIVRDELRDEYRSMRHEMLNERGTIVFLLGRNLETPADVSFMQEVLEESPCLSLGDCSKEPPTSHGNEVHQESGQDVTRAYPQLVALQAVDKLLTETTPLDPVRRDAALQVIHSGEISKDGTISRMASQLAQKLRH